MPLVPAAPHVKHVGALGHVVSVNSTPDATDGAIAVFRQATKQHHVVSIFVSTLEPAVGLLRGWSRGPYSKSSAARRATGIADAPSGAGVVGRSIGAARQPIRPLFRQWHELRLKGLWLNTAVFGRCGADDDTHKEGRNIRQSKYCHED
jgi:hypothetical protein